jgi:gamma-glutamylcyclotransferase (GGCT)/AIG2-like uncharacterized protein YtfP
LALMFLTGDGMSGGPLHHHISGAQLIGERQTAPRYRLYSVRDEFPALSPVSAGGKPILGELYDAPMAQLWDLLGNEPPELELSMVELDAQAAVLQPGEEQSAGKQSAETLAFAMVLRRGEPAGYPDITDHGGWRAYRRTR